MENMSQGTAVNETEVLRRQVTELERTVEDRNKQLAEKAAALLRMEVKLAFCNSRFLRERTLLSAELAFKAFGDRFTVLEGAERRVVAMVDGRPMQSQQKPGALASVDEALAVMMENDPDMTQLLRATPGGSGTAGAAAMGTAGLRVISASDSAAFSRNLDEIAAGRVLVR